MGPQERVGGTSQKKVFSGGNSLNNNILLLQNRARAKQKYRTLVPKGGRGDIVVEQNLKKRLPGEEHKKP